MSDQTLKWGPIFRASTLLVPCEAVALGCTSACLLGVSLSKIFSIIFCVLLILFAIVFGIMAWKTTENKFIRIAAFCGAVIMPFAGIACIVVDVDFVKVQNALVKTPLYMLIAIGIIIDFGVNIIQLINVCSWGGIKDRLLSNNVEVTVLILMNVFLGLVLGLTFGLLDVEDASQASSKMTIVTLVYIFAGAIGGFLFCIYNEYRVQKMQKIGLDPLVNNQQQITSYDKM